MLDARASLGDVLVMQRKYDEAVPHYRAFLALRPGSTRILVQLGQALDSSGHLPEAVEAYQQAVQAEPRLTMARLILATCMRLQRPETVVQATEAVRIDLRGQTQNLLGAAMRRLEEFRGRRTLLEGSGIDRQTEARRNLDRARQLLNAPSKCSRPSSEVLDIRSEDFPQAFKPRVTPGCFSGSAASSNVLIHRIPAREIVC